MVAMRKTDKMLMRMIQNSKGQFAAIVTILTVGITVFIAMSMTSVNMGNTLRDYYSECHFADLFVTAADIPLQKVKELEKLDGVRNAEGRIVMEAPVITDDARERVNVRLISSKGEGDEIDICHLLNGKWLKAGSKETLVVNQFAQARGINMGDKIKIQANGVKYTLNVSGIVANPEFVYLMENAQSMMPNPDKYGVLYISEALARQMSGVSGVNDVVITYADIHDEETIIRSLERGLKNYGLAQITKQKDQMSNSMIQDELSQLDKTSASVPFIFMIAAGFILMMMLGRMVKRDRVKIGILKAMGYGNREIVLHYTKYAAAIGVAGGVVGGLLGVAASGAMTKLYLTYFNIPLLRVGVYPRVIMNVIILSFVFCVLAGIFGARGVLKILPADSMKSESPKAGKRIFLERISPIWKNLSFSQKLVVKNIFRNKRRAFFVLTGVALTYAMMLFPTSMPQAIDEMMNKHYQEFQKMDYIIGFRTPINRLAANDLSHLIHVKYMEGKLEYPFEFENGNRKQVVSVIGVKNDTAFYTFKDANNSIIKLPESGVLVSENLAKNLKLRTGDTVKLNTFIPGKSDVYIEVKGIIKQALGMNAYMDIGYMGEKLMEKNAINGVYLDSDDEKIYERLAPVSKIASVMSVNETREIFVQYMSMMNVSITFMIIFSGILGFCIVYNTTTILIGEREMEFSALRVLGLSQNDIFKMILHENNLIMAAGLVCGLPLGLIILSNMSSIFSTDMYNMNMKANIKSIVSAAAFTVLFVFFAQFTTYQKIRRLDLLSALKNRMN